MSTEMNKQKEGHGALAAFAWIGSGIYLFATSQSASFISWQSAVFFILGMFVAAIVFGLLAHFAQQAVANLLGSFMERGTLEPTPAIALLVKSIGVLLLIAQVVVVFLAARWCFHLLI